MVVRDTPGVWSTLNISTSVHTPVLTFHRLADLVVTAVQVVGASGGLASGPWVLRIALEARKTEALPNRANCIGSTLHVCTEVRFQGLFRETGLKRISFVARLTATVIASDGVDADRILPTDVA